MTQFEGVMKCYCMSKGQWERDIEESDILLLIALTRDTQGGFTRTSTKIVNTSFG